MTDTDTAGRADATDLVTPAAVAGVTPPEHGRGDRVVGLVQRQGALAVLIVVAVIGAFSFPDFATTDNAAQIAITAAFPAMIALGMTFVIISGGIDLSVGSVYALGGVLGAYGSQWGLAGALGLPLAVCGAIGLGQGLLIARTRMAPFIVTLAGLLFARGLLLAVSHEGSDTYLVRSHAFAVLGQGSVLGIRIPILIAVAAFGLGLPLLNRTGFGHAVFAVGGNEDAARLMGVPVARTKVSVYVMSALLAGFAGTLNAAYLSSGVPILGVGYELNAIAAVVIGGTLLTGGAGTIGGTVAGVLLTGVLQNLINQIGSLPSSFQQVVSGAFLAVVVVVQTYLSRARRLA